MLELVGRNPITYESASEKETNIINQLAYVPATKKLYENLWQQREAIGALTKRHLGLGSKDACTVFDPQAWIRGSFNVCIPVEVKSGSLSRKVVLRCPMPHKLAEAKYPGTVDEKLSCEVGAYIWMQDQCADVRIPHLFGFGFSDGRHFTHVKHRPFYVRIARMFWRRIYSFFRYPILSQYTRNRTSYDVRTAYMLLEYIGPDTGRVLSDTWDTSREDPGRRQKLYRSMARIILSLARISQPRIGSFQLLLVR